MPTVKRPSNRTSVTMRDVARLANVSQSTVSRVLSGAPMAIPVGEDARRRVLEAVDRLGYQPNLHAGSLRGQKTRMIAVMIADIANPFYHPLVRGVQDVADEHAYDVMVTNTDHRADKERSFVASVIRRPVDGVILVPSHLTEDEIDDLIARTGAEVGVVGQQVTHPGVDVAFGDDERAAFDLVTWLHTARAHTRIGLIGVPERFPSGVRRRHAYRNAMAAAGLPIPEGYEQLSGDWAPASGYGAMQQILALAAPPTAVFVYNDLMALGAMEAVLQRGLHVPGDIAIVSIDDIPAASWVRPRLTTVAQYPNEMGSLLTQALFQRILGEYGGPSRRIEVPCRFVERESA